MPRSGGEAEGSAFTELFLDVRGDNVAALEAVAIEAFPQIDLAETFYRGLPFSREGDSRLPLASSWTSRFLGGGGFAPTSRLLLWRAGSALPAPIACADGAGGTAAKITPCGSEHVALVEVRDEAGAVVDAFDLERDRRIVTGLHAVGGDELPASVPFGVLGVETVHRDCLGITAPLSSYVATLTEAQGRFGFALRGVPLD